MATEVVRLDNARELHRRNFVWLLVTSVLTTTGLAVASGPVMQTYLLKVGLKASHLGTCGAVGGIVTSVGMFALIGMADRVKRRVALVVLLGLLGGVAQLVYVVLNVLGGASLTVGVVFTVVLVLTVVQASIGAMDNVVSPVLFVRVIAEEVRGRYSGIEVILCGLASVCTGLAVGSVLELLSFPGGFTLCFLAATVLFVAGALFKLKLRELPASVTHASGGTVVPWQVIWSVVRLKEFRMLLVPNALRGAGMALMYFAWIIPVQRLDLPSAYAGLGAVAGGVTGIAGGAAIALFMDRWGPGPMCLTGYLIASAAFVGAVTAKAPALFLAFYAVALLGMALVNKAVPLGTYEVAPRALVGAFNGARMLLMSLSGAVFMLVVGHLLEVHDPLAVFIAGAVACVVSGVWYWRGFRRKR